MIGGLFRHMWKHELFSSRWSASALLTIIKRGNKAACENYSGIGLTNFAAKISCLLRLSYFTAARDRCTGPSQEDLEVLEFVLNKYSHLVGY